jgi:hypothetical protein
MKIYPLIYVFAFMIFLEKKNSIEGIYLCRLTFYCFGLELELELVLFWIWIFLYLFFGFGFGPEFLFVCFDWI